MEQQILDLNDKALHAPALFVVAAFAIALGYLLTQAEFFPNRLVPLVIVSVTTILFPALQYRSDVVAGITHASSNIAFNATIGFVDGFAAWAFHGLVLGWLLSKFGIKPPTPPDKPPGPQ